MKVLIVDDDDFALDVLQMALVRMGYEAVCARDGREALEILRRGEIRLVITDWDMPVMNGVELCRAIRSEDLNGYVYIIMFTAREGAKQRIEGLCSGADDFLTKPLDPDEIMVCLKTGERILALETRDLALFALAKLAESRDTETGAHVERVQAYTRLIARNLSPDVKTVNGVDEEFIRTVFQTSPLHDLGKVGLPDSILLKPGKLTSEERAIMQTHTVVGADTLNAALDRFPSTRFLQVAREIALSHHERYDGMGYPHGLVGEQIPISARIVAVADVYDALTSRRVYKEASTHEQAKAILIHESGSHFDPECIASFLRAEQEILTVRARLRDEPGPKRVQGELPTASVALAHSSSAGKILIVEDDAVLMAKLKQMLSATGATLFCATTGREALQMWHDFGPRVIISDWVMPEMDGVELCRQIRSQAVAMPSHFIMLTVHSDKARLLEAYQAGVDDFVSKPFDCEELLARVRAGVRNAALQDELVARAIGSQEMSAQLATVNSRLERLSITDELTGVFNRRHAMMRLDEHWAQADRFGRPLSIAMIDIDHFKQANDTY
ncbi:MAG: response regulator, partial [Phycisphaerae bacterium]|nr:response regulator [Phycisphaerae bacterium]